MLKYEICVLCGNLTDTPVDMPVDARKRYIVGCGELCEKCHIKLSIEQHKEKQNNRKEN